MVPKLEIRVLNNGFKISLYVGGGGVLVVTIYSINPSSNLAEDNLHLSLFCCLKHKRKKLWLASILQYISIATSSSKDVSMVEQHAKNNLMPQMLRPDLIFLSKQVSSTN